MRLLERGKWVLLWAVAGLVCASLTRLFYHYPETLDSALFGPTGAAGFGAGVFLLNGGYLGLGLGGLWPSNALDTLPIVPSAAPLHVFGLLGAGFLDLSSDRGLATPPSLCLMALLLGGLWSRRLGPHREIWSWDVVEITAVDLLASEFAAEHFWQKRPIQVGVAWGGGEVRLFRNGMAASHHHLSNAGLRPYAHTLWHQRLAALAPGLSLSFVYWLGRFPETKAIRLGVSKKEGLRYGAPIAFGEASLAVWAMALLAPSSGAISAWGFWGAPFYLWLCVCPLFTYLGLLPSSYRKPLWVHYPLTPLAHVFATPLPWAPYALTGRFFMLNYG